MAWIDLPTLIKLREARLLSRAELARAAGVADMTIARIETGESAPNTGTMAKLAKGLGLTPEEAWAIGLVQRGRGR